MTAQVFISLQPALLRNWRQAFTGHSELQAPGSTARGSGVALYWLDWSGLAESQRQPCLQGLLDAGRKVIVMTSKPDRQQAMALFSRGIRGYCHRDAAAPQLSEIALVVEHGGIWLDIEGMQSLIKQVVGAATTLDATTTNGRGPLRLDLLTERELAVAEEVSRGANNHEIAERLKVSERTVKAHLSVVFEKLQVRDRLQLALALNNIPIR